MAWGSHPGLSQLALPNTPSFPACPHYSPGYRHWAHSCSKITQKDLLVVSIPFKEHLKKREFLLGREKPCLSPPSCVHWEFTKAPDPYCSQREGQGGPGTGACRLAPLPGTP